MKFKILGTSAVAFLLGVSPILSAAEIPKQETPKSQLKYASSLKRERKGLKGEEKRSHLKEVAEAYAAVGRYFPESIAEVSEASFRLGEIRRTLRDRDGAFIAFEKAYELKGNRRFAARALLEIGHLHRRAKEFPQAISTYEKVVKEFPDQEDQRDSALLWVGRARLASKDNRGARTAWKEVLKKSSDPMDKLKAYDLIAGSYLSDEEVAKARETIEKCKVELSPLAEEDSSQGARLKKALERMRSVKKLEALEKSD